MSDLTTYRKEVHDPHHAIGPFPDGSDEYISMEATTIYIPDGRLQAIADTLIDLDERLTKSSRIAQGITLAANGETANTEHITEHLLTGIHASTYGVIREWWDAFTQEDTPADIDTTDAFAQWKTQEDTP
jgi:hypothetical protein